MPLKPPLLDPATSTAQHPPAPLAGPGLPDADRQTSEVGAARWHVALLGGLQLRSLSHPPQILTRLPSRPCTALLARLVLAPQRLHPREELIELLWPGVALDVGRNRLRQTLSSLRSVLEPAGQAALHPVLQADRSGVRVVAGALDCDVRHFEAALRGGRAAEAALLYRGELLPGFYDNWIDEERLRLSALHTRFDERPLPPTAPRAAVEGSAPTAPAASPKWERATQPNEQLPLPHYLTPLFGAGDALRALLLLLQQRRLVTLTGPGGAGKTRLAVEAAHALRRAGAAHAPPALSQATASSAPAAFDLVVFVPMASALQRVEAINALCAALQVATLSDDPLGVAVRALAVRHALLVIDNFEQLVGEAQSLLGELLQRLPRLHLLVTSRRSLGLHGECEFSLAPLTLPSGAPTAQALAASPAVALFIDRARAVRGDFHLTPRNQAVLGELVHALEGMPLAIELAAARVRSVSPAEMLRRLRGAGSPRLELLERAQRRGAADDRHASMQRVVAWSWALLSAEAARLLTALTLFPGDFSAAAAIALAHGEAQAVAGLLDELIEHSLLRSVGDIDGEGRFAVYQPVREFAAGRLSAVDAAAFRARLRQAMLSWARGLPCTPALAALRAEMPTVQAAIASAEADGVPEQAIELMLALRSVLEELALPADALAQLQSALARCDDPRLRARGQALLAPQLYSAGQHLAAVQLARDAVACTELDAAQRARALHALARVLWRSQRRADEVEPLLDEAEQLLATFDDAELGASLLALRAFVANEHHRDLPRGTALHARALQVWQRTGNRHAINSGLYNLAACAQNAGQHAEALRRLEPIVASARELHDWRRLSQSLNVRGNAFSELRRWAEAVSAYRECIQVAWEHASSFELAYGLWNLPRALAHLRQGSAAVRLMAFADHFWRHHFGALTAADGHDIERVRRLAARLIEAHSIDVLWLEGQGLELAQAVQLVMRVPAARASGEGLLPEPA